MIRPGDFYEDCDYHPVLCTESDSDGVIGISLVDGSYPRSCSLDHCGIRKISKKEAINIRLNGPSEEKKERLLYFNKTFLCKKIIWWK